MKSKYRDGAAYGQARPSEAQAEAGNYAKGHKVVHGMRISIENEAGTTRQGKAEGGAVWKQKVNHDYGYIRGSKGKDKDHIDVFLGPDPHNRDLPAHVIDQNNKDGSFDEHKVMLGFPDATSAHLAYHENYEPGWGGFHASTEMSVPQLRTWAYSGQSGKRKPASELSAFKKEPSSMVNQEGGNTSQVPSVQNLAVGGTVQGAALTGADPVGLGTFGAGPQPAQQQVAQSSGTPMNAGLSNASAAPSMANLPGAYTGQGAAPSFDINTPGGLGFLNDTLGAGAQGKMTTPGVAAFMPQNWNLGSLKGTPGQDNSSMDGNQTVNNGTAPQDIINLANKYGYDTSKYNLQDTSDLYGADYDGRSRANGLNVPRSTGVGQLYNDLNTNTDIGKYQRIGGLSGGWDGTALADRGASDTLYRNDNGVYTAAGPSNHYRAPTNPGWIKGEGADFVQAMMTMAPAVGGWAGLANSAGVGASAAGMEAGSVGATALNAGINAIGSGLMGGNPLASLAGSVGGYGGGAAGTALGGQGWAALGSQLGSRALSSIASRVGSQNKKSGGRVSNGALGSCYADGGSVDDPEPALTPQQIEAMASASQPYFGGRGQKVMSNQDPEGAKQIFPSLIRGAVSSTLGMGGDVEGMGRKLVNVLGGNVDDTPALPTSDFYKDVLPLKPTSPSGIAAEGLGGFAGVPESSVALKGTRIAGRALTEALPAVKDVLQGMGPSADKLLASLAGKIAFPGAQPAYALAPIKDGPHYAVPNLGDYTPNLYHGTSIDRVNDFLPGNASQPRDLHFANEADYALGQGGNKGATMQFDANGVPGQLNLSKPGARSQYEQGYAEFLSRGTQPEMVGKNLQSIKVDPSSQSGPYFRRLHNSLTNEGWTKTSYDDGSVSFHKPSK